MTLSVLSPVSGTLVKIEDVPDPVFSGKFVGPGAAVDPARDGEVIATAPIGGKISKLFPHAFIVDSGQGQHVLVHLGLDTVQLDGEGFTLLANEGEQVQVGAPITKWDPSWVAAGGRNPLVMVVALEGQETDLVLSTDAKAKAGDCLFTWN